MNAQPENDNPPVRVVFRVWKDDGTVSALFPDLPGADRDPRYSCQCYERIGQHGAADYGAVIECTRPATPEEYAPLQRELEAAPYNYRLAIRRRLSR